MTRFDLFIRNMILQKLHLQEFQLSDREEVLLDQMLREIYHDSHLLHMSIETRVQHVLKHYQPMFHNIGRVLSS